MDSAVKTGETKSRKVVISFVFLRGEREKVKDRRKDDESLYRNLLLLASLRTRGKGRKGGKYCEVKILISLTGRP